MMGDMFCIVACLYGIKDLERAFSISTNYVSALTSHAFFGVVHTIPRRLSLDTMIAKILYIQAQLPLVSPWHVKLTCNPWASAIANCVDLEINVLQSLSSSLI